MSLLVARIRSALLLIALVGAGIWYLAANPAVGRAFTGVAAVGLALGATYRLLRTAGSRRRLRTLGDLLSLSPADFEEAVAGLLARSYRHVRVVGGAADLGIDIACIDRRSRTVVVQCKRHAPGISVGSGDVQRFLGSLTHCRADRGILVTTSRFTQPARELAEEHPIELIDGEALVQMARRNCRSSRLEAT